MSDLEDRAREFATHWHGSIDQRRKYSGNPYIEHPAAVAALVRTVPHTEEMLAAAWLHDVVEDTPCTIEEVAAEFGPKVAELVGWLTDISRPSDGNRATRKAMDREHTKAAPPDAKTVKLADLIDNSHSILARDPNFSKVYIGEKRKLLPFLTDGDPNLWAQADAIVRAATSADGAQ